MNRFGTAFVFFLLGIVAVPAVAWLYLSYGHPPVAVADAPFPMEARIAHSALEMRIAHEAPAATAVPINDATLTDGARVYRQEGASCHGTPGRQSNFGAHMFPSTPQLWVKHRKGPVVGVSDDPVGETYWKVKNGIRLSGMPSYEKTLRNLCTSSASLA